MLHTSWHVSLCEKACGSQEYILLKLWVPAGGHLFVLDQFLKLLFYNFTYIHFLFLCLLLPYLPIYPVPSPQIMFVAPQDQPGPSVWLRDWSCLLEPGGLICGYTTEHSDSLLSQNLYIANSSEVKGGRACEPLPLPWLSANLSSRPSCYC